MQKLLEQFEKWQDSLDSFQKNIDKDLKEIRRSKLEIQYIKKQINDSVNKGYYLRDESKIILSAPEIIIGNVDNSGTMFSSSASKVTIRGNNVNLEGVMDSNENFGRVTTKAPIICDIAVDAGIDGRENVLRSVSKHISQAKSIVLNSENTDKAFISDASVATSTTGITIDSDTYVNINASRGNESLLKALNSKKKNITDNIKDSKSSVDNYKKKIKASMSDLKKLLQDETLDVDLQSYRSTFNDVMDLQATIKSLTTDMESSMDGYFAALSQLAELTRCQDAVEEQIDKENKKKTSYKTKPNGTFISLKSEQIINSSSDGDGNVRDINGAGFFVRANKTSFVATDNKKSSYIKDSMFTVNAENITLSSANTKEQGSKYDFDAEGEIKLVSKNINIEAVDYETEKDKVKEKMLTKKGKINLRSEDINLESTTTDGKADGSIKLNAKRLEIKSMDMEKQKESDSSNDNKEPKEKSIALGSSLLFVSEKMFGGSRDKKLKSKQIQLASDEIAVMAEKTLELQQDKAVVQLAGGDTALSGSKLELYGTTTVFGKSTFKSDVKGGSIDMDSMKVSKSFKSPATTEGVSVPSVPSSAKLNAKLKEEELKSEK